MFSRDTVVTEAGQVAIAKGSFPPLYAKARDLSAALDRSSARLLGDAGLQDGPDLEWKIRDIQARLQAFQARLDKNDEALRVQEAVLQRRNPHPTREFRTRDRPSLDSCSETAVGGVVRLPAEAPSELKDGVDCGRRMVQFRPTNPDHTEDA